MKGLFDSVLFSLDSTFVVAFVNEYDPGYPISRQSLHCLKTRPVRFRYLPVTVTSLHFISFVKRAFPDFDGKELFALSGTHVRYRKILLVRHVR